MKNEGRKVVFGLHLIKYTFFLFQSPTPPLLSDVLIIIKEEDIVGLLCSRTNTYSTKLMEHRKLSADIPLFFLQCELNVSPFSAIYVCLREWSLLRGLSLLISHAFQQNFGTQMWCLNQKQKQFLFLPLQMLFGVSKSIKVVFCEWRFTFTDNWAGVLTCWLHT